MIAALALLAGARPAAAQDVAPAGADGTPPSASPFDLSTLATSVRTGAWTHDRELNDETLTTVAALRARLAPRAGAFDGFAEGYVQAESARGVRADLVEGWLRWTAGAFELRAGRRIVVWGRADRLNPTDTIGARDYTLLVASDDEQRRGTTLVQARLGSGALTLDGYWLPEFRSNRFPLDRSRPGVGLLPDERIHDRGQFAVKLDSSGGSVDWSLSWFHGHDRTRDFVAVAPPPGALVGVQQQFPQVDVFGADFAGTAGRFGYRAEMAWTEVRGEATVYRRRSNVWAVAGIDTTLGNGWNINLQYSFRRIFGYFDPRRLPDPIARAVASQSAAVNNQLDRTQNGVTARVAKSFLADTLEAEVSGIVYLETGDAAIRPKLSYPINDRVRLTAGADIFVGPQLSYFGRVRSLSSGFLQLNFGF